MREWRRSIRTVQLLVSCLAASGMPIRSSLIASAQKLRRRSDLAAEVAALEADEQDQAEMLAVAGLMESLRAPG